MLSEAEVDVFNISLFGLPFDKCFVMFTGSIQTGRTELVGAADEDGTHVSQYMLSSNNCTCSVLVTDDGLYDAKVIHKLCIKDLSWYLPNTVNCSDRSCKKAQSWYTFLRNHSECLIRGSAF